MEINDYMSVIAVVVGGIGLLVSIFTFYKTQIKKANIEIIVGPQINIGYPMKLPASLKELYVPIIFINNGANSGTIYRCAVKIIRKDNPNSHYLMHWGEFLNITFKPIYGYEYEGIAFSLVLNARSSINKIISFPWIIVDDRIPLKEGTYELIIYIWIKQQIKPNIISRAYEFSLQERDIELLSKEIVLYENAPQDDKPAPLTIKKILDKDMEENKILTSAEVKQLENR